VIFLKRFFDDWRNWIPAGIVFIFIFVAAAAPVLSPPLNPEDPAHNRTGGVSGTPQPPSEEAPLGTYPIGYDVLHTLIWGTRSALVFGTTVTLLTAAIGISLGAASNMLGGPFGRLGMRITDAFLAFPALAGVMLITQIFRPTLLQELSPFQAFMARYQVNPVWLSLILFCWMGYSRLTYASVEQQKQLPYVEAARVVGVSQVRIFFRHILPNIMSPLLVLMAKDVGGMVILESAFVFIGISNYTEWAEILVASRSWIIGPTLGFTYWWTFFPATLALILFSTSWQLLGQRINATLNPRAGNLLE
jgi:peptide/nickel transport system permease protein